MANQNKDKGNQGGSSTESQSGKQGSGSGSSSGGRKSGSSGSSSGGGPTENKKDQDTEIGKDPV